MHRIFNRSIPVVLASASRIRRELLEREGVNFRAMPSRVDEEAVRDALEAEAATPREMATALAELKARKVSATHASALVFGCDQVLEFEGRAWGKARTLGDAAAMLYRMRGRSHVLHSAAVAFEAGISVWRAVTSATVLLNDLSDRQVDEYIRNNGKSILGSLGCYRIETEEGGKVVDSYKGDVNAVYGLPLREMVGYLQDRGLVKA